jgi:hypothetical protein
MYRTAAKKRIGSANSSNFWRTLHGLSFALIYVFLCLNTKKLYFFFTNNMKLNDVKGSSFLDICVIIDKQYILAFRSVPIGENLMHEFVVFSLGGPLPKTHIPSVFAVLLERIWLHFFLHYNSK